MPCPDCNHNCHSHNECLKMQDFNVIVENAQAIAKLKKHISASVPDFKGSKKMLVTPNNNFQSRMLDWIKDYNYRFITITFDPKKFSFNELTQPDLLHNYVLNVLWELRTLFSHNIILIREFHVSGIPHYHLNYSCGTPLEHASLILRLRYYFASSLKNRKCIHDRVFNEGGKQYMAKSNKSFYEFKRFEKPLEINSSLNI